MKAFDEDENETSVVPDDSGKIAGLAFKLWTDPYVGKLVFFRNYQGTLRKGTALFNPRTRRTERVSRLMIMKADSREDVDVAYSGDICAIIGAKNIVTGDTLCDRDLAVSLEPPTFPEPVISMSIEPNTKADQEKMSVGLQRLSEEDPTFRVSSNEETGQTIIAGMGELHLDIIRDRLFREFSVGAVAGRPQIAYRETIRSDSEGVGKFVRQSGGRGQYGHCVIKLEPNETGKGVELEDKIVGGVIPREYIKPTFDGIKEASQNGVIAGYPVIDFKVTLFDGSFHEVDSSEMAFKMAGIFAFKDAMAKATPSLLEPIMKVEVSTPDEYQGDLMGDLNRRRGQIQGMETKGTLCNINAFVPLETMFGYSTDMRSLSKGRATYSMEPSHFEQVPASLVEDIVKTSSKAPART
jgi:elongation factor G